MKSEKVKLAHVRVNTENPRTISEEKFDKLVNSILALPKMLDLRPIVVDEQMVALGGNMRYRALCGIEQMSIGELTRRLSSIRGFEKKADEEKQTLLAYWKQWKAAPTAVIIRATELTEDERREFVIKDNVAFGEWDMDMLANEWDDQDLTDWGLDLWANGEDNEGEQDVKEDEFEPDSVQGEAQAQEGDIFQLGDHRLICGDSTDTKVLAALMGGGVEADLLLTDPPYNVNYKAKGKMDIANDNMDSENFVAFLTDALSNANDVMKEGAAFYVWHADTQRANFCRATDNIGWTIREVLVWVKNSLVLGRQDYQWRHEPCLYGWKEGASHYFVPRRDLTTVMEDIEKVEDVNAMKKDEMKKLLLRIMALPSTILYEDKPKKNADHPTMKPLKLMGRLIENSTKPKDVVLDIFGGSGSTMMAAEQLGRRCYMVEYEPIYIDVICRRFEELTGKKAEYLGNIKQIQYDTAE